MPDREKVTKAIEYLNWYFTQDGGTADKNAVKAWEVVLLWLLREEQEPVKPEHDFPDAKCPNCGTEFVGELMYYLGKPITGYYKYCPGCGRAVDWND